MTVAKQFHALGEPTRLELLVRLSDAGPHTITSISKGLAISRQAARKHLQVLADAKLISLAPEGREITVLLIPSSLADAKSFITEVEQRWDRRLESLRRFVDDNPSKS